jgi:hypothetical protein
MLDILTSTPCSSWVFMLPPFSKFGPIQTFLWLVVFHFRQRPTGPSVGHQDGFFAQDDRDPSWCGCFCFCLSRILLLYAKLFNIKKWKMSVHHRPPGLSFLRINHHHRCRLQSSEPVSHIYSSPFIHPSRLSQGRAMDNFIHRFRVETTGVIIFICASQVRDRDKIRDIIRRV